MTTTDGERDGRASARTCSAPFHGRPDLGHDGTVRKRRTGHVVTELSEFGVGGSARSYVEERGDVSAEHELLGERRLPDTSPASHQQAASGLGGSDLTADLIEQPGKARDLMVAPDEVSHSASTC